MTETSVPSFPRRDDREFGYAVARLTLGAIPGIGAVAQEVLDKAVGNPLRRRQEDWFAGLGEALADLVARMDGLTADSLAADEVFVSTVAQASQQATATHSRVKREALRNIVLNTAAGVKLDNALLGSFLGYVQRFSEAHLKLLALMAHPMADAAYAAEAKKVYMGSVQGVVEAAHPDLSAAPGLLDRLYDDMSREGLLGGSPKALCSASGVQAAQTTAYGNAFLDFIRAPQA
ncbi:hypothetical protein ACO2Q0_11300 [Phenylobacterium sp. VNQ135]|uniref:hypothetical protein n=1 Tax=Phenylobacterium sp. VNQ135 TaxID=3400922 RepID=UPI003C0A97CE